MEEEANQNGSEELEQIGASGWVTTKVASAALGVAVRTVRDYVARGELAATHEGEGVQKRLLISVESLHKVRARRRGERGGGPELEELAELLEGQVISSESAADAAAAAAARQEDLEFRRELLMRLEARTREAGELHARLQLTERAESTLREDLERERLERERSQEEARQLREQLDEERSKGFWRRLFGG